MGHRVVYNIFGHHVTLLTLANSLPNITNRKKKIAHYPSNVFTTYFSKLCRRYQTLRGQTTLVYLHWLQSNGTIYISWRSVPQDDSIHT